MNKVCTGLSASFLCLVGNVPPDRDHAERYQLVLTKLFLAIKLDDPNVNIIQCKAELEHSNKKHFFSKLCIDQPGEIPRSITQL